MTDGFRRNSMNDTQDSDPLEKETKHERRNAVETQHGIETVGERSGVGRE